MPCKGESRPLNERKHQETKKTDPLLLRGEILQSDDHRRRCHLYAQSQGILVCRVPGSKEWGDPRRR